jgi:hypothetical protein
MTALRTALAATVALAGVMTANSALAYERWVNIVNQGSSTIWSVQISHVDEPTYGPDLLGQYTIPAGSYATVEPAWNDGYCRFDVLITYDTGHELALWGVNLCEATAIYTDGSRYDIDYI